MSYQNLFIIYALLNDSICMSTLSSSTCCFLMVMMLCKMGRIELNDMHSLDNPQLIDIDHTSDQLFMIDFSSGSFSIAMLLSLIQVDLGHL